MTARFDIATNDAGELVRKEHARELGASVTLGIYRLAKLAQMHDPNNQALQRQIDETTRIIQDYCLKAGTHVSILCADKATFIAGQLLKGSRSVYESAAELGEILDWCGGSELSIARDVSRDEMRQFAEAISQALRSTKGSFRSPSAKIRLRAVADAARIRGLELERLDAEQRTVRTYASAIVILRRFFEELNRGRYILPRRLKRVAQSLVDLSDSAAFLGVTNARNANHDDAGRAVNTAILAVSVAREMTADRAVLAQIAVAAMMHDVGRPRALALGAGGDIPHLPGVMSLSEEQEDKLAAGTAAVLTALGRVNQPSIRRTVVTFEALWFRRRAFIGPVYRAARPMTLHARIVAVARRYNDLVTPGPGEAPPSAEQAFETLCAEFKEPDDATILRGLAAALGLLPPSTVVQLSTGEVAEVLARSADPSASTDKPIVRVMVDARGAVLATPLEVDLGRPKPGEPTRRVLRVMSVEGWGRQALSSQDASSEHPADSTPPSYGSGLRSSERSRPHEGPVLEPVLGPPADGIGSGIPSAPATVGPRKRPSSSGFSAPVTAAARTAGAPDTPVQPFGTSEHPPGRDTLVPPEHVAEVGSMAAQGGITSFVAPAAPVVHDDGQTLMETHEAGGVRISTAPLVVTQPDASAGKGPAELPPLVKGRLAGTPLPHVLVYMLDHNLTGTLVFKTPEALEHEIHFVAGVPAKVRLGFSHALLGDELVAQGVATRADVDAALAGAARLEVLLGEYLVGHGIISRGTLETTLERQVVSKIAALTNLPPETEYEFHTGKNLLDTWGGGEIPLTAPINAVVACVREWHDEPRMRVALTRLGAQPLVFHDEADLAPLALSREEEDVVAAIVTKRLSFPALVEAAIAHPRVVSALVYVLAITRQFVLPGNTKGPLAPKRPRPLSGLGKALPPSKPSIIPRASLKPPPPRSSPSLRVSSTSEAPDIVDPMHQPSAPAPAMRPPAHARPAFDEDTEAGGATTPFSSAAETARTGDFDGQTTDSLSQFSLAEKALQQGEIELAHRICEEGLRANPDNVDFRALAAWIHATSRGARGLREGMSLLDDIVARSGPSARALLYRGRLLKRMNRNADALRDFETVLALEPKNEEAAVQTRILRSSARGV